MNMLVPAKLDSKYLLAKLRSAKTNTPVTINKTYTHSKKDAASARSILEKLAAVAEPIDTCCKITQVR